MTARARTVIPVADDRVERQSGRGLRGTGPYPGLEADGDLLAAAVRSASIRVESRPGLIV